MVSVSYASSSKPYSVEKLHTFCNCPLASTPRCQKCTFLSCNIVISVCMCVLCVCEVCACVRVCVYMCVWCVYVCFYVCVYVLCVCVCVFFMEHDCIVVS